VSPGYHCIWSENSQRRHTSKAARAAAAVLMVMQEVKDFTGQEFDWKWYGDRAGQKGARELVNNLPNPPTTLHVPTQRELADQSGVKHPYINDAFYTRRYAPTYADGVLAGTEMIANALKAARGRRRSDRILGALATGTMSHVTDSGY
jgi:hypothetical protein